MLKYREIYVTVTKYLSLFFCTISHHGKVFYK